MSQLVHALRAGMPPRFIGRGDANLTQRASLSERAVATARAALASRGYGWRRYLAFAGPAVVASIAYMDPGNFATNIQAGAGYGYGLLWVVLLANLIAMLFQALSAKLGIVTARNLAELCRDHFPRPLVWMMWVVSEFAAMATDLAEFLGGAIGLSLLLGIPLLAGMGVTAVIVYAILAFQGFGFRPLELTIGGLVAAIGLSYPVELLIPPVDWGAAARHAILPQLADAQALVLATGIVCASNWEVAIALAIAGLVNMAMVVMAAGAFHAGHRDIAKIATAYRSLTPLLGVAAAGAFLISLLASGVSSSVVGTTAGQMIMQGFVGFAIPVWLRRLATML